MMKGGLQGRTYDLSHGACGSPGLIKGIFLILQFLKLQLYLIQRAQNKVNLFSEY